MTFDPTTAYKGFQKGAKEFTLWRKDGARTFKGGLRPRRTYMSSNDEAVAFVRFETNAEEKIQNFKINFTSSVCTNDFTCSPSWVAAKVAVADQDGVLQVFSMKKGDIQMVFKTLPGPKITRLELGGAVGGVKDRIFISTESEVRGFTKKGKMFLSFDTNLTEPIRSMRVSDNNLLVSGIHAYNQYRDCEDAASYICGDRISDVISLCAEKTSRLVPILACEDRMLRVLEGSQVTHTLELQGVPTVLHLNHNDGGESGQELLYGTSDGRIGLARVARSGITQRWLLKSDHHSGGVSSLHCHDLTGDGVPDLLVGRTDGSIEVYNMTIQEGNEGNETTEPTNCYSYNCNECVTSVQGGIVGNTGYDEIVVTTYSGWIFGLTTELTDKQVGMENSDAGNIRISQDAKSKIANLRSELEEMEKKVTREREKYLAATQESPDQMSTIPHLDVNDTMVLNHDEAYYLLTLEVPTAIDNILVQSDVVVDLLDVDRNSAVVSQSACEPESGNVLLATYRCQLNTTRLELRLRTIEGQYGTIQLYVTPLVQPKCATLRRHRIPPLSLHSRCHSLDDQRPYNVLTLRGPFSLAEAHAWVALCLPQLPDKPPSADSATFTFRSCLVHSYLQVSYWKGEAEFRSDNLSTISILKQFITKLATEKKVKLEISCVVNDESPLHVLRLLHTRLKSQHELATKVQLLDALRDLDVSDPGSDALVPEMVAILNSEKEILAEWGRQPSHLDRLHGIVTDLYIDKYNFKGINAKHHVPELLTILADYDPETLANFFSKTPDG